MTSVDNLTRARKRALMQLAIAGSAALVLLIAAMVGGYRSLEKSVENDAKNFAAWPTGSETILSRRCQVGKVEANPTSSW